MAFAVTPSGERASSRNSFPRLPGALSTAIRRSGFSEALQLRPQAVAVKKRAHRASLSTTSLGTKLESLVKRWHAQAELFAEHECPDVAATYRRLGDELQCNLREWEDERLTIQEAAAESGYSEEQLRRQVRDGKLRSEHRNGSKSHIKVRRADLPMKPGTRTDRGGSSSLEITYDPEEDARSIARRLGGSNV